MSRTRSGARHSPRPVSWLLVALLPVFVGFGCDSSSPTAPRVVADFIYSGEGANLQFVDNSVGPVRFWQWHFGDGDSSIDQNPSHRYFGRRPAAHLLGQPRGVSVDPAGRQQLRQGLEEHPRLSSGTTGVMTPQSTGRLGSIATSTD